MARERYLVNAGEETIHQNEIKLESGKDKRKNWWYYNKVKLAVGVVAVGLLATIIVPIFTRVEPDYNICLLTSYYMPDALLEDIQTQIGEYADDRNEDGQISVQVVNYVFPSSANASQTSDEASMYQASLVKFMADGTIGDNMIFLHNEEAFKQIESIVGGFFSYTDGSYMPDDSTDYDRMMISWEDCAGLSSIKLLSTESGFTEEEFQSVVRRLRMSLRQIQGSALEGNEEKEAYREDSLKLFERLVSGEKPERPTEAS